MNRKRKPKQEPINFAKAMADIENMLLATHDIKQIKGYFNYEGEEITHSSVLCTCNNIKDDVSKKGMEYNRRQNRTLLKVILAKVFQLGYCQAKIEEDNDDIKQFLMDIALSTSKKLSEDLEKLKKDKNETT